MSPRSIKSKSPAAAKPLIRFIRSKKWKLYEDGRLYNMTNDRDEETPFLSANDNTEKSEIRQSLKNVLKNMK